MPLSAHDRIIYKKHSAKIKKNAHSILTIELPSLLPTWEKLQIGLQNGRLSRTDKDRPDEIIELGEPKLKKANLH